MTGCPEASVGCQLWSLRLGRLEERACGVAAGEWLEGQEGRVPWYRPCGISLPASEPDPSLSCDGATLTWHPAGDRRAAPGMAESASSGHEGWSALSTVDCLSCSWSVTELSHRSCSGTAGRCLTPSYHDVRPVHSTQGCFFCLRCNLSSYLNFPEQRESVPQVSALKS